MHEDEVPARTFVVSAQRACRRCMRVSVHIPHFISKLSSITSATCVRAPCKDVRPIDDDGRHNWQEFNICEGYSMDIFK